MRILFLHGWHSVPGGVKPTYLSNHGHDVFNPALPDDDFDQAVAIAQQLVDQQQPEVVVGSSRGGAVAMNVYSNTIPLVLLCPAWRRWGTVQLLKAQAAILHSPADEVVPYADSVALVQQSQLPAETLITVGQDHRLADPDSLATMLAACERLVSLKAKPITD